MFIDERTQNRLHAVPGREYLPRHDAHAGPDSGVLDVIRDTPEYVQVMNAIPAHAMEDKEADWWNSDDAAGLLESLFDTLDSYSPEGYYFGAHLGDGSDYGFLENGQVNVGTWYGITKDKRHDILKDGICIGQIYLARAESRKLKILGNLLHEWNRLQHFQ